MANKFKIVVILVVGLTLFLLFSIFAASDTEDVDYLQFLTIGDNYTGLDKSITKNMTDYITYMRGAINQNSQSNTNEKQENKSDTKVEYTGNGITVDGITIKVDPSSDRGKIVKAAIAMLGYPYIFGGTGGPFKGIPSPYTWKDSTYTEESRMGMPSYDCSGFCQKAYADAGITIPRVSGDQTWEAASYGGKVIGSNGDTSNMKPGDLAGDGGHVVMYLGDGYMIESPETGGTVRIISIIDRYNNNGNFKASFKCASYLT